MSKSDAHLKSSTEQLTTLRSELIDLIKVNQLGQSSLITEVAQSFNQNRHAMNLHKISVARGLLNGWSKSNAKQAIYDLTEQGLKQYAKKRPIQLIGLSFALGIAIVLVKPWRRLPKSLPATLGSLITVKLYQSLMSIVSKKP